MAAKDKVKLCFSSTFCGSPCTSHSDFLLVWGCRRGRKLWLSKAEPRMLHMVITPPESPHMKALPLALLIRQL